jgi:methionyl-tRNA formyltransferase
VNPVQVLFAGTPDVALPSLDLLVADPRFDVVAVLTNPDRPRGRSAALQPSAVASRARELDLPLLQPPRVRDAADVIRRTGAEVGAIVAYGSILPRSVLESLPHGFVNLHFSLLPRWRGAAPVQHAIRAGDTVTGVTAFRLDPGMDTGPVLRTLERPIGDGVDAGALLDALAAEGAPVLAEALLAAVAGERGIAQPEAGVTFAPRIGTEDATVDWSRPATEVARRIRSVTPRPGAITTLAGERLKLAGVTPVELTDPRLVDVPHPLPGGAPVPGTVVATDGEGMLVRCGDDVLHVARVQMAGRAWTSAADQVRGRRLAVGMVLGAALTSS